MEEKSTGICLFRQYQNYFRTSPAKNVPGRVLSIITKLAVLSINKGMSPQQARSVSAVRARTCSAEPEFGAQIKIITWSLIPGILVAYARMVRSR
jgi:hypothetical protein